jgi:hypothetical protein
MGPYYNGSLLRHSVGHKNSISVLSEAHLKPANNFGGWATTVLGIGPRFTLPLITSRRLADRRLGVQGLDLGQELRLSASSGRSRLQFGHYKRTSEVAGARPSAATAQKSPSDSSSSPPSPPHLPPIGIQVLARSS